MPHSDQELLEGCIEGSRKMQEALYSKYSRAMYVICLRYTKTIQEAEDVLQESFIKVFNSLDKFKSQSTLGYWIKKIVINTALNFQRSKLYLYPMFDVEDINIADRDFTLSSFHYSELLEMIKDLPTGSQVIFNLYAIEGFKHNEIAKMLEISEGTSKSQYARAKQLLQDKLTGKENYNYGRV
jgi:RNA polymerase sigma-70 factor (ECF subfamily)